MTVGETNPSVTRTLRKFTNSAVISRATSPFSGGFTKVFVIPIFLLFRNRIFRLIKLKYLFSHTPVLIEYSLNIVIKACSLEYESNGWKEPSV